MPPGHPLTILSNVILTPHISWPTDAGYARFAESTCEVVKAYQDGHALPLFEAH